MKERLEIVSILQNKKANQYLYASIALLVIIIGYEYFSHGVTSTAMRVSILFPFIGGYCIQLLAPSVREARETEKRLWNMGIITLMIGYFIYGVFEIYGSIEDLTEIYFIAGWTLVAVSILFYLLTLYVTYEERE